MKALLITLIMFSSFAFSEVDPPNYDFSLDSLNPFMPGSSYTALKQKFKTQIKMGDGPEGEIYKTFVEHIRYQFPVFIQVKDDVILDFYATLPYYFLHDVYHQSIINRHGMQNKYLKKESSAIYIWENINGNKHIYSGSCTITCFPIFYTVYKNGMKSPLIKQYAQTENFEKVR